MINLHHFRYGWKEVEVQEEEEWGEEKTVEKTVEKTITTTTSTTTTTTQPVVGLDSLGTASTSTMRSVFAPFSLQVR